MRCGLMCATPLRQLVSVLLGVVRGSQDAGHREFAAVLMRRLVDRAGGLWAKLAPATKEACEWCDCVARGANC